MKQRAILKKSIVAYLFMSPALLILGLFTIYPMVVGIYLAFHDYSMIKTLGNGTIAPPLFTGFKNFMKLAGDPYFITALRNSFLYLLVVPFIQILSIFLAIVTNRKIRGISCFRAAYYIPVVTSIVVVGISWKWVLASDGLLNFILVNILHLLKDPVMWLTDRNIALFSVMFVTCWQGLGYYMVLYLAGLQSIPPEFEEAARIDGAKAFQVFMHITLPLLKPTLALCSIMSCIAAMKVFGEIYVMTGGGPENGTLTVAYYIFQKAFQDFQMGYASAISVVFAAFLGLISYINIKVFQEGGLQYY